MKASRNAWLQFKNLFSAIKMKEIKFLVTSLVEMRPGYLSPKMIQSNCQCNGSRYSLPNQRNLSKHLLAKKGYGHLFSGTRKGTSILFNDFLESGKTLPVIVSAYCDNLRILWHVIQNKRHGLLPTGLCFSTIILYLTLQIQLLSYWKNLNGKLFDYPPYSPDLTPSDYYLFMHLQK